MQVFQDGGRPIKAWIDGVELEDSARAQLVAVSKLPFIFQHVAVMPDVHWGVGATIGSVIATQGAVIPAAVGVDLGCGMIAQRTSLTASQLPDDLGPLRSAIEAAIPHGRTDNGRENDRGAWGDVPAHIQDRIFGNLSAYAPGQVLESDRRVSQATRQLGTLGTGNHFVEVCLDEEQRVWVMLHSGSRGIGNALASEFIARAKATAAKYFYESSLPDKDLAWLPENTPDFKEYVEAVEWAQAYAMVNREIMMDAALKALSGIGPFEVDDTAVNCHHNYLSREKHFGKSVLVTRKGAVSAREGQLGIIPGSMGAKSFIVRGKGNRDSFHSCSHGAGRRMGRNEAKKRITMERFAETMAGVESRRDAEVLDEAPDAYKDIDAVIAAQADLIDVVHTLKQVVCVKG
ncbi:MAG: RtcB family protein [Candidatus Aquilonibacter sp.]|jgi:tRNA-splicing ligase RtcB